MTKDLKILVSDLYFDYDRLSESGQNTLDKIADLLGIKGTPTDQALLDMGLPKELLHDFREKVFLTERGHIARKKHDD